MSEFCVDELRAQFPALSRMEGSNPVAFFDGPAGSQVPLEVADAVRTYLLSTNANHAAPFSTSRESDAILDAAHDAMAAFVGATDGGEIAFGANMTTLTLAASRALAQAWEPGDEIIVSRLDHDANVTPWILAAEDRGCVVRQIDVKLDDCTLDMNSFREALSDRTRVVAVGYASNATGTVNPISEISKAARGVGALTYVDAVHLAPHRLIDVVELGADFLACSAYKFFGPHVGALWGRREILESIRPYKLRPSTDSLPGRWMTGTQCHEGIAGTLEAVRYLASLSGEAEGDLRSRLRTAFDRIRSYEETLLEPLLEGLGQLSGVRIWGITESNRFDERVPTVSVTVEGHDPTELSRKLGERGLYCWAGNHYALPFTEAAGLEPGGTLRIGILHYNTREEVDRLLAALGELVN